jgi:ribosomal protein S18 acetylase RimI-like enzyme
VQLRKIWAWLSNIANNVTWGEAFIEMWQTSELNEKSQILNYLNTDRLYAAYAIGDLEPELFAQSTWGGATQDNRLQALALHFRGLQLPAFFLMGNPHGLRAILKNVLCPERVYLTCRPEHLALTRIFYTWDKIIPMWRMVLPPSSFQPVENDCIRLTPAHAHRLTELYTLGDAVGFSPAQLAHGVFYGIFAQDQLVAVAGTHLVSETYGVAAVGNVLTHPAHRGQGYGSATISAIVAELQRRGIADIILNVSQSNESAIRIYERLGFERYCLFLEGPACALSVAN